MWLKRSLISSVFLALPLLSGSALAGDENDQHGGQQTGSQQAGAQTLEDLRQECLKVKLKRQVEHYEKAVTCDGWYTYWVEEKAETTLENTKSVVTELSTKNNLYRTEPRTKVLGAAESSVMCSRWKQMKMTAPDALNLKVILSDCDDFNPTTVAQVCKDKVQDYCMDQHQTVSKSASSSSSSSASHSDSDEAQQNATCQLQEIKVFDGCVMQHGSEVIQQHEQEKGEQQGNGQAKPVKDEL